MSLGQSDLQATGKIGLHAASNSRVVTGPTFGRDTEEKPRQWLILLAFTVRRPYNPVHSFGQPPPPMRVVNPLAVDLMALRAGISGNRPTVVVADASKMGSQLLAHTIQDHNDFRVVGSATTRSEAMSGISELQPDIAVISSRLQDGAFTGVEVLRELRTLQTRPRVIMLLDDDQSELVVESFRHGARGIFCRTELTTHLRKCILCVSKGQIWANNTQLERIVEALMQAPAPLQPEITTLSKREDEIARLVASGLSNSEVAQRLSLSRHTVKNYLFRVYEKLGISTRIELVLYVLSRYRDPDSEQNPLAKIPLKIDA
jgi:DNA-binding NarL/FixJ family response regulator